MPNSQIVREVFKDLGYWMLFGVIIALAQLWLIPFAYYLLKRPLTWVELIGNGSLLFFATTITSKTAGEYFKKVKGHHGWATLLCLFVTVVIILLSVFAYALVIAARLEKAIANALSPERVATMSTVLAAAGLIFGFAYTIYIRVFGE